MAKAVGFKEVPKTAWEFQNKTFEARVVIVEDESGEYGPSNEIKSFLPLKNESAPKAVDLPPSMDESNDASPGEVAAPSKPSL